MKKISQNALTIYQREHIALYTQEFLRSNFTIPLKDTQDILNNNVQYFKKGYLGETILKQSLVRGTFPRCYYKKNLIEKELKDILSTKIALSTSQEKTDLRFLGEILTASNLCRVIKEYKTNSNETGE